MKDVKFNINNDVKVRLTQMGKDIFYHQYDELNKIYGRIVCEPHYPRVDKDGYSRFQLHKLMEMYGQHLHNGGSVEHNTSPFETEILICEL